MGLDITAIKGAKLLTVMADVDEYEEKFDWRKTEYVYANPSFQGWEDSIKDNGVYEYEDSFSFRAGSYSGYNAWRAWLSNLALGVPPETVWRDRDRFERLPFYWLINFSDCEGVIGPEKAKSLAANFAEFQHVVDETDADEFYKRKYAEWHKAFEMASENGYVEFH